MITPMQPSGQLGLPVHLGSTNRRNDHQHPQIKTAANHHQRLVVASSQVHANNAAPVHGILEPSRSRAATGEAAPPVGAIGTPYDALERLYWKNR